MGEVHPSILALLATTLGLGSLAFVVVTTTAFMKIAVVLFLVRNALGTQQIPPNMVLYGAALILTVYISAPVAEKVFQAASEPQLAYQSVEDWLAAARRVQEPIRAYLGRFASPEQSQFFLDATRRVWPEEAQESLVPDDLRILVPSFLISELKRGFEIGFLLYLPFIVIDLVVTTILMAMGMSSVSPNTISIPFKLFLFIAIDGWSRLLHGLVLSYAIAP
ncbi:type III secretion system export apparatus subunit SctR [Methylobacterium sp. J-076]|uniref:type III secretion system export apparatus subunit SctR n=1 Tax=Methylobacterium sp. J-076 TaxID=2836655 RepID=UPI001FBC115F|nr:type III secretion system export apparatus subunit SctR [Methylobacterium sp. J-076]MCJ2013131.1 type III secretion system export apparatus subunit SctR [Methylobacterium sp. J-076]